MPPGFPISAACQAAALFNASSQLDGEDATGAQRARSS